MLAHRHGVAAGFGRTAGAGVLAIALSFVAGCATRTQEPPSLPTSSPVPAFAIPADARVFDVDPARSNVTFLVYRAGPLARLGHNHVVTSGDESGFAWRSVEPVRSGFELRIPVAALVVDDPAARAAAGPDFAGEVPASAREGTYANLTGPAVLDAARYPEIVVRSSGLAGSWDGPVAVAEATLKGQTGRVEVPLDIEESGRTLTARGAFRLRQTDFGLAPFSVAGGAIQVADEVDVRFEIVAVAR